MTDQQTIDEVYRRRARQLARLTVAESNAATLPVLVFGIGQERYGIELSELAEVFAFRGCTAVPAVSPALLGVINVRGDIRAVVDLRRLLDIPNQENSAPGYVVMLRRHGAAIGFRVDTIDGVRRIDPAQMNADSARTSMAGSRFVKALVAGTLILIDTTAAVTALGLAPE